MADPALSSECIGFVMVFLPLFFIGRKIMRRHFGIKRAKFDKTTREGGGSAMSSRRLPGRAVERAWLDRIPVENIRRTVELVERRLQCRDAVLGEGLRRPAFGAMDRAQRP